MGKTLIIKSALVGMLLLFSCTKAKEDYHSVSYCRMVNGSGVTVSIAVTVAYENCICFVTFPDAITLEDGGSYEWHVNGVQWDSHPPFGYVTATRATLIFDGEYTVPYTGSLDPPDERDPRYLSNYIQDSDGVYQYIFTVSDYENSIILDGGDDYDDDEELPTFEDEPSEGER